MIKGTWIAKIKEIGCWTEELITFCPFPPVSAWSKKLQNFPVKHVDLSWDFGMTCLTQKICAFWLISRWLTIKRMKALGYTHLSFNRRFLSYDSREKETHNCSFNTNTIIYCLFGWVCDRAGADLLLHLKLY